MESGFAIPLKGLRLSIRRNDDITGITLYPSPTAGNGRPDVDKITGQIDGWRGKCCGMYIRPANGASSPGTANEGSGAVSNNSTTGDPTVSRGLCPFCGSANNRT